MKASGVLLGGSPSGLRRRGRRVVVVVAAASGVAALVLPWVLTGDLQYVAGVFVFVMALLTVVVSDRVHLGLDLPDDELEDGTRARRERAARIAVRILSGALLGAGALAGILLSRGSTVTVGQGMVFLYPALMAAALPTWVLAWTEPDAVRPQDPGVAAPWVAGAACRLLAVSAGGAGAAVVLVVLMVLGVGGLTPFGGLGPVPLRSALAPAIHIGLMSMSVQILVNAGRKRRI